MPEETAASPKIKTRKPKQRACDEKDEKGKLCNGHLKRYYDYPKEVAAVIGPKAEIYRCEFRRATLCEIRVFDFAATAARHAAERMDL
jgi:hypothetical protein